MKILNSISSLMGMTLASTLALTLGLTNAQAKTIALQPTTKVFQKGNTIVPQAVLQACVGDVVNYKTRYQGTDLMGRFWVKTHADDNCTGNGGKMTGYFEERSANGRQFCSGQMTMEFNARGFQHIRWDEVKAVPKYDCVVAGKTFELFL